MAMRIILALLLVLIGRDFAQAFTWDAYRQSQIENHVRAYQSMRGGPTIAIAVTVNGTVVHARAFGPGGVIIPNGENIRFQIGSVTKQFTAAGILALIEDGEKVPFTGKQISLDTSVDDYFENVGQWSVGPPMTIRRLLNMTSNIPSYTSDPAATRPNPTTMIVPAQATIDSYFMLESIKRYPLQGIPGMFNYSNTNYFLLARIIHGTKNAGLNSTIPAFHNYIRSRIFAKAGMNSAGFIGEPTPPSVTDAQPTYLSTVLFNKPDWPLGAGDIIASVADVARWNCALMSGAILTLPSVGQLMNPAAYIAGPGNHGGCSYAMGWFICERPGLRIVEHDGEISGFRAYNTILQSPGSWASITLLVNSDAAGDLFALGRQIVGALN